MAAFAGNTTWADVEPVPQDPDDARCAQIAYTAEFAETMGYFRAILRKDEKSQRALDLTARVIAGNAANYTAWAFRRECLFALGSDLRAELLFVTEYALRSPKNYQIWFHRRAIVDKLGDGSQELDFVGQVLDDDSKNYHAWSHRQFVLERFGMFGEELPFVESLIEDDARNNSAWNQRWFVVSQTTGFDDAAVRARELEFAFAQARRAPNNESPFNYIKGLMRLACFEELAAVRAFAEGLLDELRAASSAADHPSAANPPPLLGLLVSVWERSSNVAEARALCTELGEQHDTIRAKYWRYRAGKMAA